VFGHAPAVWIEEVGDVSRIQAEQPDIVLHIPLVEALLTVKVLTIEEVLQDISECEAAAAARKSSVALMPVSVRYWLTASQMKNVSLSAAP
jgi:hypothetical protein